MSATDLFLTLAIVWLLVGSLIAFFMARRGHASFTWWVVGVVLGPLAVPIAIAADRRPPGPGRVIEPGRPGSGPVDVLVNGRLVARAEVVVIAGCYGVRILEVVSAADRAGVVRVIAEAG